VRRDRCGNTCCCPFVTYITFHQSIGKDLHVSPGCPRGWGSALWAFIPLSSINPLLRHLLVSCACGCHVSYNSWSNAGSPCCRMECSSMSCLGARSSFCMRIVCASLAGQPYCLERFSYINTQIRYLPAAANIRITSFALEIWTDCYLRRQ
jgi:hypothetical protein